MTTDVRDAFTALVRSVLEAPGATDPSVRASAFAGEPLPDPIQSYVTKIRNESYRVTDTDITALLSAGYSEDAIFEVTLAAAIGAASDRLEAGMDLLRAES